MADSPVETHRPLRPGAYPELTWPAVLVGYALGISVVITLLGSELMVSSFDRAYSWVAAAYAVAAVAMAVLYPKGSAADRQRVQASSAESGAAARS